LRLLRPVVCAIETHVSIPLTKDSSRDVHENPDNGGYSNNVHLRTLAEGYPQEAQVCFWMWRERRPISGTSSQPKKSPFTREGHPRLILERIDPAAVKSSKS